MKNMMIKRIVAMASVVALVCTNFTTVVSADELSDFDGEIVENVENTYEDVLADADVQLDETAATDCLQLDDATKDTEAGTGSVNADENEDTAVLKEPKQSTGDGSKDVGAYEKIVINHIGKTAYELINPVFVAQIVRNMKKLPQISTYYVWEQTIKNEEVKVRYDGVENLIFEFVKYGNLQRDYEQVKFRFNTKSGAYSDLTYKKYLDLSSIGAEYHNYECFAEYDAKIVLSQLYDRKKGDINKKCFKFKKVGATKVKTKNVVELAIRAMYTFDSVLINIFNGELYDIAEFGDISDLGMFTHTLVNVVPAKIVLSLSNKGKFYDKKDLFFLWSYDGNISGYGYKMTSDNSCAKIISSGGSYAIAAQSKGKTKMKFEVNGGALGNGGSMDVVVIVKK